MNQELYNTIVIERAHRAWRKETEPIAETFAAEGLEPKERMTKRFELLCKQEQPRFLAGERIAFLRTAMNIPDCFTEEEWADIRSKHYIHESGYQSNLTIDYAKILKSGLLSLKEGADEYTCRSIDALLELTERYRRAAEEQGLTEIAETLSRVPAYGARSFLEALQSMRIVTFGLWLEGDYHNTLGRFDQYMHPYFQCDMEAGLIDEAEALELVEEFFLSLNRDSDLYPGVQQGDNGQSLMLGGRTKSGEGGFNKLSELCLIASRNLKLIDPKINIRVDKDTPEKVYTLCSELTKVGLGFPQYSNDDVVIPGLIRLGYTPEDAVDYSVAACWEFIVPGNGKDIPNIAVISFPKVIDTCLHRDLPGCQSLEEFYDCIKKEIEKHCRETAKKVDNLWYVPSPLLDRCMNEIKYRNYGMHGVGLSTAADSLTAIMQHVFEEKTLSPEKLIEAVDTDFASDPELLHLLRYETPKLGCGEPAADENLEWLLDAFAAALQDQKNEFGGCWRAGTGSAMFYLWSADEIGASPDGRRKGESLGANYSISLFARPDGPFSIVQSMARPDLTKTINGGPLTLEFHDGMFRSEDATAKVGRFVRQFILQGGHQLQLNAVNADTLRAAQKDPEAYQQLIVRVWGWSAYFVELDQCYQDHVIARQEYSL